MLIYLQVIDAPEDRDQFITLYETYRGLIYSNANQPAEKAPCGWICPCFHRPR